MRNNKSMMDMAMCMYSMRMFCCTHNPVSTIVK